MRDRLVWMTRNLGLAVMIAVIAVGLCSYGYAADGAARAFAWLCCAVLGTLAMPWLVIDARHSHVRSLLMLMLVIVAWTGVQCIPLPITLANLTNPGWHFSLTGMTATSIALPSSLPIALNPEAAIAGWHQAVGFTAFFAAAAMIAAWGGWRSIACLAAALGLLEGVLGLGGMVLGAGGRAWGAIYNPNHHAALTLSAIPLTIAFLWNRNEELLLSEGDGLLAGRDPGLIGVALLMAALLGWLGAFSRGSLILGIPPIVAWVAWEWWNSREEASADSSLIRRWGGPLAAATLTVLVLVVGSGIEGFGSRLAGQSEADSVNSRPALVRATAAGLMETRLVGLGLHGTEPTINRFAQFPTRLEPIYTHNDWMQFVAEIGLPGLALLAIATFFMWRRRRIDTQQIDPAPARLRRAAAVGLISMLMHALVDFHLRIPLVGMQALLLATIVLTPPSAIQAESTG